MPSLSTIRTRNQTTVQLPSTGSQPPSASTSQNQMLIDRKAELWREALQQNPPPDPKNRTGEIEPHHPLLRGATEDSQCSLDNKTTYQWHNWAKHQNTCWMNKAEKNLEQKENKASVDKYLEEEDDDEDMMDVDALPIIPGPSTSSNDAERRIEAAYDLLYYSANDVFFGTPEEKTIVRETLVAHPEAFNDASLLLALKEKPWQ
ncbi:hypothetical protein BT96DRAFT_938469 [Gymnopus androsaceus JB14]|uniref:Uncharacterized protein n=1 Tax=Gymnopus androsaceus JB14 TaxID=1447944 RepID=A0A6A4HVH7_9AGAR|nr:hypothetical protein BT96DRAFT_938469 [Gymnopus androsaceus JB14]